MHDQRKCDRQPLTDEQREKINVAEKAKGELYLALTEAYRQRIYTQEKLNENGELLMMIPEAYSLYNYRRVMLLALWEEGESGGTVKARSPLEDLVKELKLNAKILEKDMKVYAAFGYRHWVFEEIYRRAVSEGQQQQNAEGTGAGEGEAAAPPPPAATAAAAATAGDPSALDTLLAALTKEKNQCERLLSHDGRNFHAWNHRRWVLQMLQRALALKAKAPSIGEAGGHDDDHHHHHHHPQRRQPTEEEEDTAAAPYASLFDTHGIREMAYTTAQIKSNFSNYSAWHQRALAITHALFVTAEQTGTHPPFSSVAATAAGGMAFKQRRREMGKPPAASAEGLTDEEVRWCNALVSLLREDLHLLTQAVYCDPNDQSAWFYASFMLSVFAAFEKAFPEFVHDSSASGGAEGADGVVDGSTEGYSGKAIEDAFLLAVLELIVEEGKLGDGECYLPLYFLFCYLAHLIRRSRVEYDDNAAPASSSTTPSAASAKARLGRCVELATAHGVLSLAGSQRTPLYELGETLYRQLLRSDTARKGLYEDLWLVFQQS